jgi:hypothetical protein
VKILKPFEIEILFRLLCIKFINLKDKKEEIKINVE